MIATTTLLERGLGLALLGAAALLAGPALQEQAVVELMRHSAACLSGGKPLAGPVTFLGHCALCWAAGASALAGLGLLTSRRRA